MYSILPAVLVFRATFRLVFHIEVRKIKYREAHFLLDTSANITAPKIALLAPWHDLLRRWQEKPQNSASTDQLFETRSHIACVICAWRMLVAGLTAVVLIASLHGAVSCTFWCIKSWPQAKEIGLVKLISVMWRRRQCIKTWRIVSICSGLAEAEANHAGTWHLNHC